jgi:hypothetical protein
MRIHGLMIVGRGRIVRVHPGPLGCRSQEINLKNRKHRASGRTDVGYRGLMEIAWSPGTGWIWFYGPPHSLEQVILIRVHVCTGSQAQDGAKRNEV